MDNEGASENKGGMLGGLLESFWKLYECLLKVFGFASKRKDESEEEEEIPAKRRRLDDTFDKSEGVKGETQQTPGDTKEIHDILQKIYEKIQDQTGLDKQEKENLLKMIDDCQKKFGGHKQDKGECLEILTAILKKIGELEKRQAQKNTSLYDDWRKEGFQAVEVTLDETTAHPALCLSEQGRRVTWKERRQDLASSSQRFDSLPCVLGFPQISTGRCFWEIDVGETGSWELGICRDNVKRNGKITMSPQNGFWVIRFYDGQYEAVTSPETSLSTEKPRIVGICLDYEAARVSFYNMTNQSHMFTFFNNNFNGDLIRPLFRLWSSDSGPLTIVQQN